MYHPPAVVDSHARSVSSHRLHFIPNHMLPYSNILHLHIAVPTSDMPTFFNINSM
jgi:hypothetical protein